MSTRRAGLRTGAAVKYLKRHFCREDVEETSYRRTKPNKVLPMLKMPVYTGTGTRPCGCGMGVGARMGVGGKL